MKKRIIAYGTLAVVVCGVLVASFIYSANSEKQNAQSIKRSEDESAKQISENPKSAPPIKAEAQVEPTQPVSVAISSAPAAVPAQSSPDVPDTPDEIKSAAREALALQDLPGLSAARQWYCFESAIKLIVNHNAGFGGWSNYNHIMRAVGFVNPKSILCSMNGQALAAKIITASCAHDETKPNRPLIAPLTCNWE